MQVLTATDVNGLVSLKDVRDLMKRTLQALKSFPESPQRFVLGEGQAQLGIMPERGVNSNAVKIVSLAKGKGHEGVLALFDNSGNLKGVIEAGILTALRTAAVSVAVTEALHPRPKKIAIVGRGRQGQAHVAAFREAFPEAQLSDSLVDADLICTTTTTTEPLVFPSELPERVHINAIGSCVPHKREIPEHVVRNSKIFADSRERALKEAGDLVLAGITDCHALEDLFSSPLRHQFKTGVTLFKSIGLPCEDLALAELIVERAYA